MSGCRDDETSADTTNTMDQRTGAFTNALCECLRKSHHNTSILSLHKDICIYLEQNGYSQQPILSSTVQVPLYMFLKGEKKEAWTNQIAVTRQSALLHQYVKKPENSVNSIASDTSIGTKIRTGDEGFEKPPGGFRNDKPRSSLDIPLRGLSKDDNSELG